MNTNQRCTPKVSGEEVCNRPQRSMVVFFPVVLGIIGTLFQLSCGSGSRAESNSQPSSSSISVKISPIAVSVPPGKSQQFSATVTGTDNFSITWSITEGDAGGSISGTGLYVAPAENGTFHVVATSQADSSKSATAEVLVEPVSIEVTPSATTTGPGRSVPFKAVVSGTSDTTVTWNVLEGTTGGTISNAGVYTAPPMLGTYHVAATSVVDTSKSATATVTVTSSGFFVSVGSLNGPRDFHTATLLTNGQVLVTGGTTGKIDPRDECAHPNGGATAELYDPSTHLFDLTGNMHFPRFFHTATLLGNGNVLVAGGFGTGGYCEPLSIQKSAEIYDIATGSFVITGSMGTPRAEHTATMLTNGKVLIVGGSHDVADTAGGLPYGGYATATAELYDPATRTFTPTGSMAHARYGHTATLLPNGKVLITGGISSATLGAIGFPQTLTFESSAEIYDPQAGTFTPAGDLGGPRAGHTATLLPDGKVLIAGGLTGNSLPSATAEIYDPVAGTFTPTGSMSTGRALHTATLLNTGKVLIVGEA
jgi:Galactose oxidase, central domain/Bacterial Ig-like domain (group 2)